MLLKIVRDKRKSASTTRLSRENIGKRNTKQISRKFQIFKFPKKQLFSDFCIRKFSDSGDKECVN